MLNWTRWGPQVLAPGCLRPLGQAAFPFRGLPEPMGSSKVHTLNPIQRSFLSTTAPKFRVKDFSDFAISSLEVQTANPTSEKKSTSFRTERTTKRNVKRTANNTTKKIALLNTKPITRHQRWIDGRKREKHQLLLTWRMKGKIGYRKGAFSSLSLLPRSFKIFRRERWTPMKHFRGTPETYALGSTVYPTLKADGSAVPGEGQPPRFERHLLSWSRRFIFINSRYRPKWIKVRTSWRMKFSFQRRVRDLKASSTHDEIDGAIHKAWVECPARVKRTQWRSALLLALHRSPPDAVLILQRTFDRAFPRVPSYAIQNAMTHLAEFYIGIASSLDSPTRDIRGFLDLLRTYLKTYRLKSKSGDALVSQHTLRRLIDHSKPDELDELQELLEGSNSSLALWTKLLMIRAYVGYDRLKSAIDLLRTIPREEISTAAVQYTCGKILRTKWNVENLYNLQSALLSHMLELGVRPDISLCNIIIANAMDAGDRQTAWGTFDIILENGLVPTVYTYSTLLLGIKHGDDLQTINMIYQRSKDEGLVATDPFLAAGLLHAVGTYHELRGQKSWDAVLALYSEIFDIEPLKDLGLIDRSWGSMERKLEPMRPLAAALGYMLLVWLSENYQNKEKMLDVYGRFMYHVRRHKRIALVATESYWSSAFIRALGTYEDLLPYCTEILKFQLQAGQTSRNIDKAANDRSNLENDDGTIESDTRSGPLRYTVAPPNSWNWNCLLFAFGRHRMFKMADQIQALMKSRGFKPDEVTFASLLSVYSNAQRVDKVVQTIQRMEAGNFRPDAWAMKALAQVIDRNALITAVRKAAKEHAEHAKEEETKSAQEQDPELGSFAGSLGTRLSDRY